MKTIYFCILIILISSCDYGDGKLKLKNNSNDTLFYYVTNKHKIEISDIPNYYRKNFEKYKYEDCLIPKQIKSEYTINETWEERINEFPDKKIEVFFFKKQLLDTTQWDLIVKQELNTKLLELSLEDLKKMNWVVEYK